MTDLLAWSIFDLVSPGFLWIVGSALVIVAGIIIAASRDQ